MRRTGNVFLLLALMVTSKIASAYEVGNWDVHGTFSQGWIHSEDNNFIEDSTEGTFDFREYGVNATTTLGERTTIGGQLFAREFGTVGNDDIYLDWLNLSYSFSNAVGFRAGKLKMPYGLYGETRDVDSLRTQILLPQSVYVESVRGSINSMWGGAVFGYLSSDRWGSLDYSLQAGQSAIDEDSGEINRLASYIELEVDNVDDGNTGALKLFWEAPSSGLRVGTTLSWSEFSVSGPTDALIGIPGTYNADLEDQYFIVNSVEYTVGRAKFAAEQLYSNLEARFDTGPASMFSLEFDINMLAYYFNGEYRFTDRFTVAAGITSLSVKQKPNIAEVNPTTKEKQEGYYLSLRYDITPNLIAKFEQHFYTGEAALFLTENPDGFADDWSMSLVKLSFVF
ncbi:MAG: hypothetical protein Hals2KO_20960 [Halioglobus sp.]